MTSDGAEWPPGALIEQRWWGVADSGLLDICQPLMKEFNLVENLKQPCLTGTLTGFNSLLL